jgi:hypothetical protein
MNAILAMDGKTRACMAILIQPVRKPFKWGRTYSNMRLQQSIDPAGIFPCYSQARPPVFKNLKISFTLHEISGKTQLTHKN